MWAPRTRQQPTPRGGPGGLRQGRTEQLAEQAEPEALIPARGRQAATQGAAHSTPPPWLPTRSARRSPASDLSHRAHCVAVGSRGTCPRISPPHRHPQLPRFGDMGWRTAHTALPAHWDWWGPGGGGSDPSRQRDALHPEAATWGHLPAPRNRILCTVWRNIITAHLTLSGLHEPGAEVVILKSKLGGGGGGGACGPVGGALCGESSNTP